MSKLEQAAKLLEEAGGEIDFTGEYRAEIVKGAKNFEKLLDAMKACEETQTDFPVDICIPLFNVFEVLNLNQKWIDRLE